MIIRLAVLLLIGSCLTGSSHAQTLLRWKLKPPEQLAVDVQQQTTTQVAFSGKSVTTRIDLGMQLGWSVTAADDDAGLTIKQSVERITFKLDSEKAGVVEYDSAAQARPTGQARAIADAVKPLLGAEVEIVISSRGEVLSVKPANAAAQALLAITGKADTGVFSPLAVQKLLKQPLVMLPEKAVAAGETWQASSDLIAAAGAFQQTTTYTLAPPQERDGQKLEMIDLSATLELVPAAPSPKPNTASKLTLKSHEQSGTILFSAEAGRLVEASQTQKLVTERPYRETTIVVTLESTQTTTIKPK